jgi:hypothetical protein
MSQYDFKCPTCGYIETHDVFNGKYICPKDGNILNRVFSCPQVLTHQKKPIDRVREDGDIEGWGKYGNKDVLS